MGKEYTRELGRGVARQLIWSLGSQRPTIKRIGRIPTLVLCSRNARHQKNEGVQATILLARRAPTIKRWSFDARSEGRFACSLIEKVKNQNVLVRRAHSRINQATLENETGD